MIYLTLAALIVALGFLMIKIWLMGQEIKILQSSIRHWSNTYMKIQAQVARPRLPVNMPLVSPYAKGYRS